MPHPMRPSLLRNNGNGTFTDVTQEAGLMEPANSICATWADYDNDGFLDLFVCCETGPNRLYRNRRDGTVEAVLMGTAADVAAVIEDCQNGPLHARVTGIETSEAETVALDLRQAGQRFSVLPTV